MAHGALAALLAICTCLVVSHVQVALEQKGIRYPICCGWYTLMYLLLFYLTCLSSYNVLSNVLLPTGWFNSDIIRSSVGEIMSTDHNLHPMDEQNITAAMESWLETADLSDWPVLKLWTMLAPVWVICTLLVCVYHTWLHVKKIVYREGGAGFLCNSPEHDQTMKILVLPSVYALMSFNAVGVMWMACVNRVPSSWVDQHSFGQRQTILIEAYDAYNAVAKIYEAIAMLIFSKLLLGVLKKKIDKMKEIFATETNERGDGKEMQEYINRIVDAVASLTMFGMKVFAWTTLCDGLFHQGFFEVSKHYQFQIHWMFSGAGLMASGYGFGNIGVIKTDFEELLKEFSSDIKLLSVKILMSLVSLQPMGMPVLAAFAQSQWDGQCVVGPLRAKLFCAATVSFECFVISVLHLKSYSPDEIWYGDYDIQRVARRGMRQPLLPKEAR